MTALFTMFSYVEATTAGLVVVNPGSANRISWEEVRGLSIERGLTVDLRDGRTVACYAFQPSMLGGILGYPGARRAARRIERIRAAHVVAAPSGEGGAADPTFPWRRHACLILGIWAFLALLIPAVPRLRV
ncbi:PH domain-containing protein [Plantactinospora sp. WMMB334]|uniref:PH domain-containing protein n=1 Tax=Plantactinospora sp. WMMB334 TaxID=3404119 RepID=UPI003B9344BE